MRLGFAWHGGGESRRETSRTPMIQPKDRILSKCTEHCHNILEIGVQKTIMAHPALIPDTVLGCQAPAVHCRVGSCLLQLCVRCCELLISLMEFLEDCD
jgi:hypothetical protein